MYTIIVNIIGCVFRYLFVVLTIKKNDNYRKNIHKDIVCCFIYIVGYRLLQGDNWRNYIFQCLYTVFIIWINLKNTNYENNIIFSKIGTLLSIYEIGGIVTEFIGFILLWFVSSGIEEISLGLTCSLVVKIIYFLNLLYWIPKSNIINSVAKWIGCLAYLLIICLKVPFLYTEIQEAYEWKLVAIAIICCTVIFLIISRIDKHNAEKERAKIEENNKKLSSKLHKSQEILPAMVQVLSNVTENGGTEMEEQEAHKLLEEVSDLYGQQLKENSKEDLQLKNFCSTGLKLLDEQLKVYQMEALDRNVNLDIFVQAPINGIMKKDNIDQLKLQRAVGDLIRNAFRVMEREDKKCRAKGHILLIIGCQYEGILEIAVVDNGAEFPLHVIQAFGRRGVTTGGMGNGLADLVEFADETKASIRVDEFAWETSSFTKKISIIFDKQRMNYFNSSRRELIESSFWNNN